jgi:preprotein translocase subunit SecY
MKNFITTLKNIWSIDELRQRIILTISLLIAYRFGSYVVLPGVVPAALERAGSNDSNSLTGLINAFTGGAFHNASILALGVMPYISASIFVQLLGFAVPYFQRLQQREGESGRRRLNSITRWLTVVITLVQATGYLTYITSSFPGSQSPALSTFSFWLINTLVLTAGTVFSMWLGERITERGLGNGTSLIIMSGIVSRLPGAISFEIDRRMTGGNGGLFGFILILAALVLVVAGMIMLIQGVRKIPIQFAKRMVARGATEAPIAGNRDYLPIKVNSAGVMPIIFAQALMFLPATALQFMSSSSGEPSTALKALNDYTSIPYNIFYFFLVLIFTYVYTALLVNPQQYAEHLKRQNSFIPGVKPGEPTAEFIDTVTTRITLPGAIFLGIVAILPAFASLCGVNSSFAMFFGGTSILIMIGVILDTLQQIESHLLMRRYDGLIQSGRVRGRNAESVNTGV